MENDSKYTNAAREDFERIYGHKADVNNSLELRWILHRAQEYKDGINSIKIQSGDYE